MNRFTVFGLSVIGLLTAPLYGQEDYGHDPSPVPPGTLPASYRNSQVLPTSVSPDGKYGLVYPKYELSGTIDHPRLLLATLKPFHVLAEISRNTYLQHGHQSYSVEWAKDSSAVLVNANAKWGPDKVFLVPVQSGKVGRIINLIPKIEERVRPDYQKAKAERKGDNSVERFNDVVDFIFESDYEPPGSSATTHESWVPDSTGMVKVVCFCTNDPKGTDLHTWTALFDGVWDISRGKFVQQKVTRLSNGDGQDTSRH